MNCAPATAPATTRADRKVVVDLPAAASNDLQALQVSDAPSKSALALRTCRRYSTSWLSAGELKGAESSRERRGPRR